MSRIFTDASLRTWEVYASGGPFGLPEHPKIVFHCLSEPNSRARFVVHQGDEADAEQAVHDASDDQLREMLQGSGELD